jgi:fructose PTS system EIIBC or EIIC component
MKISEILTKEFIIADMKSTSKNDAILELLSLFKTDPRVVDMELVQNAVLERENIMSTGVGKGFAIPHAKTSAINDIIVSFGKLKEPIDFKSLDEQPVSFIFLLVGKESQVGPHIKLLSRISRMMNKDEFRESLLNAQTSEDIYNLFAEEEKNYLEIN